MSEATPSTLDAGESLMSSDAPADNAAVGGTEMSCPDVIVNIGIFFDGTFNNAFNTANNGEGVDSDYTTNVYRLSQRYKTAGDDTRHEACGTLKEVYRGRYVQGIGTALNQDNDGYGGGTGHGAEGLATKATEAARWYASQINGFGGLANITEVNVDIFGFSRGAATARFFANVMRNLDPKVTVRFLGVYDTVGSFGIPGNSREMTTQGELTEMFCELPLMLQGGAGILFCAVTPEPEHFDLMVHSDTATAAFHVIADDEFRSMFPVTRVTPGHGVEIHVPGCHGDAAGAAPAHNVTETHTNPPQWLIDRGFFAHGTYEFVDRTFPIPNQDVYRRTVAPGIGPVTLSAMLSQGDGAGVPFTSTSVTIPGDSDLNALHVNALAGRSLPSTRRRAIAARFAHSSHDFGLSGIANWAESGGVRTTYPNQP